MISFPVSVLLPSGLSCMSQWAIAQLLWRSVSDTAFKFQGPAAAEDPPQVWGVDSISPEANKASFSSWEMHPPTHSHARNLTEEILYGGQLRRHGGNTLIDPYCLAVLRLWLPHTLTPDYCVQTLLLCMSVPVWITNGCAASSVITGYHSFYGMPVGVNMFGTSIVSCKNNRLLFNNWAVENRRSVLENSIVILQSCHSWLPFELLTWTLHWMLKKNSSREKKVEFMVNSMQLKEPTKSNLGWAKWMNHLPDQSLITSSRG